MMADRIIAVSHITKDIIVQNYHIPPEKIEVVYNAIDVDCLLSHEYDRRTYEYIEDLKEQGYTNYRNVDAPYGAKGLSYFVRVTAQALAKHDKLAFVLLGDGEQRDRTYCSRCEPWN